MAVIIFWGVIALIVVGIIAVRRATIKQIDSTPDEDPFPGPSAKA